MRTIPINSRRYYSILTIAIVTLYALFFSSCKKSSDVGPDFKESPVEGTFTSELNGKGWAGQSSFGVITDGKMIITTTHANGDELTIELHGDSVGKYMFIDTLNKATYTSKLDGEIYYARLVMNNIGEVIITQIDTNYLLISGNLDLYLKSNGGKTVSFRNGAFFKIPYSYTSIIIPYNMQGFINGVPFTATAQANRNYIFGSSIFVAGLTADTSNITLFISAGDTLGNYTFPQHGNATFIKNGIYYSYGTGNVQINYLDQVNKIMSGKFDFYAVNKNDNLDSVFVKQGTFTNLRYP